MNRMVLIAAAVIVPLTSCTASAPHEVADETARSEDASRDSSPAADPNAPRGGLCTRTATS